MSLLWLSQVKVYHTSQVKFMIVVPIVLSSLQLSRQSLCRWALGRSQSSHMHTCRPPLLTALLTQLSSVPGLA